MRSSATSSQPSSSRAVVSRVEAADRVASAVTALFVPGDRPERFPKAAAAGPDVVIIDWEDAVAPEAKPVAAAATIEAVAAGFPAIVRMNAAGSPTFDAELDALINLAGQPGNGLLGVMLPKAEATADLERVRSRVPAWLAIVPLIESASGLVSAVQLASIPGVTRLAFGAIDFALDIGADDGDEYLGYARSALVVASRAAGIAAPLDTPTAEFRDEAVVAAAARRARGFGFGGKLCIHPRQVEVIAQAFRPDEASIAWARQVVGAGDGVSSVNGAMVDRPVVERAKEILRRASLQG